MMALLRIWPTEPLRFLTGKGDFEVEGKIFLGCEYPAHHPIQTETAKQVWDALTYGGFCTLYDEGCAWPLRFSSERPSEQNINEKLENWLGMEIENDNR